MLVVYPTDAPAKPITCGAYTVDAAADAPVRAGCFPLAMISHGSGGSQYVYRTLALYLARNGFVVGAPEHPFNNRHNNERADTIENLIDRPRHMRLAIDAIFLDETLKGHVQTDRVSMIGHSMGVYTALALAGGVAHTKHQIEHDPRSKITRSQEIRVTPDARISSIVALAPAAGWFKSENALANVKVPILMFTAERDNVTPIFHATIIEKGAGGDGTRVIHKIVENANHYSFLSPFPESMKNPRFLPAQDPDGFDRESFHRQLNNDVLQFLQQHAL